MISDNHYVKRLIATYCCPIILRVQLTDDRIIVSTRSEPRYTVRIGSSRHLLQLYHWSTCWICKTYQRWYATCTMINNKNGRETRCLTSVQSTWTKVLKEEEKRHQSGGWGWNSGNRPGAAFLLRCSTRAGQVNDRSTRCRQTKWRRKIIEQTEVSGEGGGGHMKVAGDEKDSS